MRTFGDPALMTQAVSIGDNVKVEVRGDVLVIEVDLSLNFGPSSSGKSIIIASSKGNADVPGKPGVKFGLNVYSTLKK